VSDRPLVLVADDDPDILNLVTLRLERDGYEVAQRLRSHDATKAIPIILLTARAQDSDVARGVEAGADDYVKKPFSTTDLRSRVQAALGR